MQLSISDPYFSRKLLNELNNGYYALELHNNELILEKEGLFSSPLETRKDDADFILTTSILLYKNLGKDTVYLRLSYPTIFFLHDLLSLEKERSGCLHCFRICTIHDKQAYCIHYDDSNISSGTSQDVDTKVCSFSYHSHPKIAYIQNKVKVAYPSLQDYLAYYDLVCNELDPTSTFHIVSSLEGIYLLSVNIALCGIDESIIEKVYRDMGDIPPREYVKRVNALEPHIFHLQFYPWKGLEKKLIAIR